MSQREEDEEYEEGEPLVIEELAEPPSPSRVRERAIRMYLEDIQSAKNDPWTVEQRAHVYYIDAGRVLLRRSRNEPVDSVAKLVGQELRDEVKEDIALQTAVLRHRIDAMGEKLTGEIRATELGAKSSASSESEPSLESRREDMTGLGVSVGGFLLLAVGLLSSSLYLGLAGFVLVALAFIHIMPLGNSGD